MKTEYISLVVVAVETSICVLDILGYMDLNDCFFLILKRRSNSTDSFNSGNKKP